MKRDRRKCLNVGCPNDAYLGGLCRSHHQENQVRTERRNLALTALHFGTVDGDLPADQALHDELERLRRWWDRACQVVQTRRGTTLMPLDEADFATDWCIALSQEIVEAQRALTAGRPVPSSLPLTRRWVWERFHNLESGLRSNGMPRESR